MNTIADQLAKTGLADKAAEELEKDRQLRNTRPRCICHNVYFSKCPKALKNKPWNCLQCSYQSNSSGRTRCYNCGFIRKIK